MSPKTSNLHRYKSTLPLLLPLILLGCGGYESSDSASSRAKTLSSDSVTQDNSRGVSSGTEPTQPPIPQAAAVYSLTDIDMRSAEITLRDASFLLLGRLPTAEESAPVLAGGEQGLDASLNLLFQSNQFYEALAKIYNDELNLTRAVDDQRLVSINLGTDWWGSDNALRGNAHAAIRNAGLALVKYVAKNDKPISEILTADYLMVNPFSARTFDVYDQLGFTAADDANQWKPVKLVKRLVGSRYDNNVYTPGTWQNFTDGTDGSFGHSGLLTDIYWLENYPFTNTNLNRERANKVFKQFLDFDVLSISAGTRIISSEDGDNPTINNPNCNVCHRLVDPVASAFLQRNNQATYNPTAALTRTTLFPVGFNGKLFPLQANGRQMGTENPLQWLGKQIVQDPRFLPAQVHIVYRGLIGKDVLRLTEEMTDTERQAFEAQQALFTRIITDMQANNQNIKIAFRELIKSPYFRATGISNSNNLAAHPQTGSVRLLPIDVINNKINALLGVYWTDNANPDIGNQKFLRYQELYGTPKSSETGTASNTSSTNTAIQQQFATDMSCRLVPREFYEKNAQLRRLLKFVEMDTTPLNADGSANASNAAKIQLNIQYLYRYLLGQDLPLEHSSIQTTYQLWLDTWQKGKAERSAGTTSSALACPLTQKPLTREALTPAERITNDPNYVLRSWTVVLNFVLSDPQFFYQ